MRVLIVIQLISRHWRFLWLSDILFLLWTRFLCEGLPCRWSSWLLTLSPVCVDLIPIRLHFNFNITPLDDLWFGHKLEECWLGSMQGLPLELSSHINQHDKPCEHAVDLKHDCGHAHELIGFLDITAVRILRFSLPCIPVIIQPFLGREENSKEKHEGKRCWDQIPVHDVLIHPHYEQVDHLSDNNADSNRLERFDIRCDVDQCRRVDCTLWAAWGDQTHVVVSSILDKDQIDDQSNDDKSCQGWGKRAQDWGFLDEIASRLPEDHLIFLELLALLHYVLVYHFPYSFNFM